MSRPVFIIGAARSGTNLVRALLSAHPSIELRNEPELVLSLIRAGVGPDDAVPREDRVQLLFELGRTGLTRQHMSALPPAVIEEFLTADEHLGLKDVYELLLPRPDPELVWGEKSLGNAYLIPEIASLYPDALFVHVMRDPRAATRSWVALRYLEDEKHALELDQQSLVFVAYSAMRWANWTEAIDRDVQTLPDAASTTVRFEELVEDPRSVLQRLCSQLEIEFDERMLDPESRRNDPAVDSREAAHRRLLEPIDPARASSGDQLPLWAATVVEHYAGEGMARHGYGRREEELPAAERSKLNAQLEFVEPILRERLARDLARSGPPEQRRDGTRSEALDGPSTTHADSLAALAATAVRRRGVGADSQTEVEALRSFAAAALDELEDARSARLRTQRRLADANAALRADQGRRKKRSKPGRKPARKRSRRRTDTES
jgi:hypothetical protein